MSQSTPVPSDRPVSTADLRARKGSGEPLVVVTAYDAPSARFADAAGVDAVLVGDSLAMTVLGLPDTLRVTMEDMIRHTAAAARGAKRALVIGDMPFMSFQVSVEEALRNAARFITEADAGAVKLEGGRRVEATVRRMVETGIPVMGHVGLTPQSVLELGGYKTQAKEVGPALELLEDCRALEQAGAFAIVLECIPAELAEIVSSGISVPTIGIGAGAGCDGQVQVLHDVLGLGDFTPRHATHFAEVGEAMTGAISAYVSAVREGSFPAEAQCTHMDARTLSEVEGAWRGPRAVASGEE